MDMTVAEEAKALSEKIITWRRALHQIPETGLHCPRTAALIQKELDSLGIPWQAYPDHSGITAMLGPRGGTVIALRADMDGLPVREENRVPYASRNGCMHACGHDAHAAMLLGAAALLKKRESRLRGGVELIFQPGEEDLTGARAMLADGVLEHPKVTRMYTLHVGSIAGQKAETGTLLWKKGAVFASSNSFRIRVKGKGGHASTPFLAVSPILAAQRIISSLEGMVNRETTYNVPSVIVFTGIRAGSGAYNIIPDRAEIIGGMRTQSLEVRDFLMRRMQEVTRACAAACGASAELEFVETCPPVINDAEAVETFLKAARKVLPDSAIEELQYSTMGGEDAAYYFTQVPGCYAFLSNAVPYADGKEYPHHSSRFCIDDSVLWRGSGVLAQVCLDETGA